MKILFSSLLLIIIINQADAQKFIEKCFEPIPNSGFTSAVVDSLGNIFVAGSDPIGHMGGGLFTKININGEIAFQIPIYYRFLKDIAVSNDNNFLICGQDYVCDVFDRYGFIVKCSSTGNIIWTKRIMPDSNSTSFDNYLQHITVLSNNNIAVSADSTLYYLTQNGDFIWSKVLNSPISSLDSDGLKILIGADTSLMVLDTTGNILNQKSFSTAIEVLKLSDSLYLIEGGINLFTLDTSLSITKQINLNSINLNPGIIASDKNRICISNYNGNSVACFDYSLILTDSFSIQPKNVIIFSLVVKDTMLWFFGAEPGHNANSYYHSFSIHGGNNFRNTDVGISNMRFDSIIAVHPPFLPDFLFNLSFVPTVTIINKGTEKINSINLNSIRQSGFPPCGFTPDIDRFNNLNLSPGDSIDLTLRKRHDGGGKPLPYIFNFCVWSSCPDSAADIDHSNDYYCDSFNITTIVSIEELESGTGFLYPNPVKDILKISNSSMKSNDEYFIINYLGVIIETGYTFNNEINTKELENGIYFLRINSETKSFVYRFTKIKE